MKPKKLASLFKKKSRIVSSATCYILPQNSFFGKESKIAKNNSIGEYPTTGVA